MHIIRAFTHLQVRRIPERYILKRYTRDAKEEVTWDRHDGVRIGAQASKEQCRCKDRWTKRGGELGLFQISKTNKTTLTYAKLVSLNSPTGLNKANYSS